MTGYAEFAVTTNFSFLRGASHGEELVMQAKELGLAGLGVADRNSVAGVVRAHQAAKEAGLPFAPGARLVFCDGTPDILAYPESRSGWGRLTQLLTLGKRRTEKGQCLLRRDDLFAHAAELNLVVMPGHLKRTAAAGKEEGATFLPALLLGAPRGGAPRLARRQHALSRRRCAPPRPARRHRERGAGAAYRHRRRALPRARAASPAGRHDLHPRASDARQCRTPSRSQCRAPPQAAAGNGAPVPRRAGRGGADAASCSNAAGFPSTSSNTNIPTRPAQAMPRPRRR